MARSTSELRQLWAPACAQNLMARVTLYGGAVVTVRASTVDAWLALSMVLMRWRYEATGPDCGAYNCRPITGGTGYSLHAYGIATDINWQDNPYGPHLKTDMDPGMIADIEAIRTNSGAQVFRWGGRYSGNKDAMHFEVVCTPADLASGIASSVAAGPPPIASPSSIPQEGPDMFLVLEGVGLFAQIGLITVMFPDLPSYANAKSHSEGVPVLFLPAAQAGAAAPLLMNQTANVARPGG